MLDDHAHVMQVKLCKANTRGVTGGVDVVEGVGVASSTRPAQDVVGW